MAGACDCATVKLAKVGGLRAAMAIAAELPVYLSSALDGPVGIAAAGHLAQVLPDAGLAHGLATANLFDEGVATREWELSGPRADAERRFRARRRDRRAGVAALPSSRRPSDGQAFPASGGS